jgi:hypothetical protein
MEVVILTTKKVKGKVVLTTVPNQEILDDDNDITTVVVLNNVTIQNMSEIDVHVRVNQGDEILIQTDEQIKIVGTGVDSIIVKEKNSKVRYIGLS